MTTIKYPVEDSHWEITYHDDCRAQVPRRILTECMHYAFEAQNIFGHYSSPWKDDVAESLVGSSWETSEASDPSRMTMIKLYLFDLRVFKIDCYLKVSINLDAKTAVVSL